MTGDRPLGVSFGERRRTAAPQKPNGVPIGASPSPQDKEAETAMSRALLVVVLILMVATACNGGATVGDVITEGIDDTRLEIELVEVHNPAELDPEDDHAPHSNARLVAVELRLRNIGDSVYDGRVMPATRVTSNDGTEHLRHGGYGLQHVSVAECEAFSALTLASGEIHAGCVVFGIEPGEDGDELETFQLMLDGEGGRPMRWQLNA